MKIDTLGRVPRLAQWFDPIPLAGALRRIEPALRHPATILGTATVAALLCGLVLHPRGLALAGGLAAILALGVAWPWVSLAGLRCTIAFERQRGREGQPVELTAVLKNRAPWGAWGLSLCLDDSEMSEAVADDNASLAVIRAEGWRTTRVTGSFVPRCRGEYPIGPSTVTTGFPFGLRRATRRVNVERKLLVWPRTFPVGPIPDEAGGDASEGFAVRDRVGDGGDILGVRAYRRGDPLRRVHWGQTARFGELIVCERQAVAAPRVQVILDIHPSAHVGTGPDSTLEWSIRIAASFLDDWIGQGADAELVTGGAVIAARGGTVAARRTVVLDALARVKPDARYRLGEVLAGPSCRAFGRGLRVVVGTDRSPDGLIGRLPRAVTERYVLLRTSAFVGGSPPSRSEPWPVRPWIGIDDPSRVADQVLRARKEAFHGG